MNLRLVILQYISCLRSVETYIEDIKNFGFVSTQQYLVEFLKLH